jgi:TonB family protein
MLLSMVAAGALAGAATSGPTIDHPAWETGPTGEALIRYYPLKAQRSHQEGSSTIRCSVTAQGGVTGCVIVSEKPEGWGFGEAAIKLSPLFKMKPKMADGSAVEGGIVKIPVQFKIGGQPSGLDLAMQCYAAHAGPAAADPKAIAVAWPAAFYASHVIAEAALLGDPPSNWEKLLAQARSENTDEAELARLRVQCKSPAPPARKN